MKLHLLPAIGGAVLIAAGLTGCAQAQPVGQYLWQRPAAQVPLSGAEQIACNQGATPQTATTVVCRAQDIANLALPALAAKLNALTSPINISLPSSQPTEFSATNSDSGNTTPFLSILAQSAGTSANRLNIRYGNGISFDGVGGPSVTFGAMLYKCPLGGALCVGLANNDGTSTEPISAPSVPTGALRVAFLQAFNTTSTTAPAIIIGNGTPGSLRFTPGTLSQVQNAGAADGDVSYITDATACTFNSNVTGGGSTHCIVHFDGSSGTWKAG